jgi:hypothetical protein
MLTSSAQSNVDASVAGQYDCGHIVYDLLPLRRSKPGVVLDRFVYLLVSQILLYTEGFCSSGDK